MQFLKKFFKGLVVVCITCLVLYVTIGVYVPKSDTYKVYVELTNNKEELQTSLESFTESKIEELATKAKAEKEQELTETGSSLDQQISNAKEDIEKTKKEITEMKNKINS